MQKTSGAVTHAKLGGIQFCMRWELLLARLTGSLHDEAQLGGILAGAICSFLERGNGF